MSARLVIWQDDGGDWRWRLVGANGEIVAVGARHGRERDAWRDAWRAAERVGRLASEALAGAEDTDGDEGDSAPSQP